MALSSIPIDLQLVVGLLLLHLRCGCGNSFISVFDHKGNWTYADDYCREQYGTQLATIWGHESALELYSVTAAMTADSVWIGLRRSDNGDFSEWASGFSCNGFCATMDYWNDGEPNNAYGAENCAELRSGRDNVSNMLNDVPCSASHFFVCDSLLSSTSSTASPMWTFSSSFMPSLPPSPLPTLPPSPLPTLPPLSSTVSPTMQPTQPTYKVEADWIRKSSALVNCPDGYRDLPQSSPGYGEHCEPCSGNSAGVNGRCADCGITKGPNHERTGCEDRVWWKISYGLISSGAVVTLILFVLKCRRNRQRRHSMQGNRRRRDRPRNRQRGRDTRVNMVQAADGTDEDEDEEHDLFDADIED